MGTRWGAVCVAALLALGANVWAGDEGGAQLVAALGTNHEKALQDLLDKNQPEEAARYWGEHRSYFWDNADQFKPLLARLKSAVNTPHEARMGAAEAALKPFAAQPLPISEWSNVIRALSEARIALDAYRALPITIDDSLRSDRMISLDATINEVVQVYVASGPTAFAQYDHVGMPPFRQTYPVEVPDEVIAAGYLAIKPRLEAATGAQIAAFREAYGKVLTATQRTELAQYAAKARYRELVPDGKITAAAAARLVTEIGSGKLDASALPVRFGFLWSKEAAKNGEFPIALKVPEALSAREIGRRDLPGRLAESDVVVFIDVDRTALNRNMKASRKEYSRFKSSEHQVLNPAYLDAQALVQQKQMEQMRAESGGGFSFSLDPIALVAGLAKEAYTQAKSMNAKANLKQAQDQLAATPRMISEDVMADYQYSINDVEVTRRIPIAIYVIDVKNGGYLKQTTEITEKQRFESVDGLHPRDPDRDQVLSRFPPSKAVDDYVASPVTVDGAMVLNTAFGTMQDAGSQPIAMLPQDIERGAVQTPLSIALGTPGQCDAFFDTFVEQYKIARCAAEAESLKGVAEAVGGAGRSAAESGILTTARTPELYKSVPQNDDRWVTVGESAQPNCGTPLAVRNPQDAFMECVRMVSCASRTAACGRELTRQNRAMSCPEAAQRCTVVYPVPQ